MNGNGLEQIKETARIFCEGIIECDYLKISSVFHPEAQSIVLNQKTDEFIILTREHWKQNYEENPCDPNIKSSFEIVDIQTYSTLGFAHVKIIDEFEDKTIQYTDFLSLIKSDDKWFIMNKTGHGELIKRI
jgi:hypothetical protein